MAAHGKGANTPVTVGIHPGVYEILKLYADKELPEVKGNLAAFSRRLIHEGLQKRGINIEEVVQAHKVKTETEGPKKKRPTVRHANR